MLPFPDVEKDSIFIAFFGKRRAAAPTELQQNTPARAVNELHRAGAPVFYKENAQRGDFRQYRTILSADTASEARQLLSQKRR